MKLYNTRTRKKEEFTSITPPNVGMYCCGPTVYNYAHIGNLRTYVFEDLLRRVLEFNGFKVNHVMNITDVGHLTSDADAGEDKMKKGAEREHKNVWEIAEHYTNAFMKDMERLNLLSPTETPKATDCIKDMVEVIKKLETNGYTYQGENGNVYFDTEKFEKYGDLAQLDKQELQAGARIEVDPNKKHPHDFVLWFVESKHGEQDMRWDSPWGYGFPGWHIECSAMSHKHLGDQFDIHCGGIDHVPVHHTNEIAQSEGAFGKSPWVNFWMHGEFLTLKDNEKMAKSEGNFLTLQTLIDKGYSPLDYRYMCLQAHYRKQLMFDWEGLDAAKTGFRRLKDKVMALNHQLGHPLGLQLDKFTNAISEDLNLPQALALTWEVVDDNELSDADKLATIMKFDEVLGLNLTEVIEFNIPDEIQTLIDKRNKAREEKDWAKSDEIRDQIQDSGWIVKDGPNGTEVTPK